MIKKAISFFPSKAAFCRAVGIKEQFLSQIESGKRPLPSRVAIAIEKATGGQVTVEELRPDLIEHWAYIRGTAKASPGAIPATPSPPEDRRRTPRIAVARKTGEDDGARMAGKPPLTTVAGTAAGSGEAGPVPVERAA